MHFCQFCVYCQSKHVSGYVMPGIAELTEDKFCVFNEISTTVTFVPTVY
jgi:hypothetical protein